MSSLAVTVVINPAYRATRAEIEAHLTELGLMIEDRIPETGILFGQVAADHLPALQADPAVIEARPEDRIQLPPSDEDTPQ